MKDEIMNPLEKAFLDIVNKTASGIESGVNFLVSELPDVVYQLLLWHGIYNGVRFVGSLVLALAAFSFFRKIMSIIKKDGFAMETAKGEVTPDGAAVIFLGIATAILAILSCVFFNLVWLKIWLAPKVWLIEYAATLVK